MKQTYLSLKRLLQLAKLKIVRFIFGRKWKRRINVAILSFRKDNQLWVKTILQNHVDRVLVDNLIHAQQPRQCISELHLFNIVTKTLKKLEVMADIIDIQPLTTPYGNTSHIEYTTGTHESELRTLRLEVVKRSCGALTRSLNVQWSMDTMADLNTVTADAAKATALFEDVAATSIAETIIGEIFHQLIHASDANASVYETFKLVPSTPSGFKVRHLQQSIAHQTKRGSGNYIIVPTDGYLTFESLSKDWFVPNGNKIDWCNPISLVGHLPDGQTKVYVTNASAAANRLIVGYHGTSHLDGALTYSPYQLLNVSAAIDPNTYAPVTNAFTRYAITTDGSRVRTIQMSELSTQVESSMVVESQGQ